MSSGRLAGKVAVITGGTSGIGRAGVIRFAREGASVVVGSRDRTAGEALVRELAGEGLEVAHVPTDVARAEDAARLVEAVVGHHGRLDILWSNAGVQEAGTAPETSEEIWERVIGINLTGHFHMAKFTIPVMTRQGGGAIIFTASELGLVGASSSLAYCAAKGGVVNMTRAMAIDCAPAAIRVNCLCPGAIRTPMLERWFREAPDPALLERRQTEPIPLGRLGRPEEIAAAAVFLASDESSYMTGAIQLVDGGVTTGYGI
jgi:NAD(P)-dependent dehydrogenase (short-subunit alcohol dehydrogenase family)